MDKTSKDTFTAHDLLKPNFLPEGWETPTAGDYEYFDVYSHSTTNIEYINKVPHLVVRFYNNKEHTGKAITHYHKDVYTQETYPLRYLDTRNKNSILFFKKSEENYKPWVYKTMISYDADNSPLPMLLIRHVDINKR